VVALTVEQLATQQVKAEEKQRVLGIIPNFFVVYDAVPLTTKLKYELAFRSATDVVSIAGDVVLAGVNQAADTPNYQQGAKGFGQRFGAASWSKMLFHKEDAADVLKGSCAPISLQFIFVKSRMTQRATMIDLGSCWSTQCHIC